MPRRSRHAIILADDEDFVRRLVQETLNEVLESEMTEFLGAGKSERTQTRQSYRSGYYRRGSDDEGGRDRTEGFAGTQRPVQHAGVRALSAFGEGTGGGVVGDVCAWGFDAPGEPASGGSMRSRVFAGDDLDHGIEAGRVPEDVCGTPAGGGVSVRVVLDARYEKMREEGSVRSRAVQIALGIDGEGRRQVLAAEVAEPGKRGVVDGIPVAPEGTWPAGVEYVVSDSHEGLKHAISKVLPTALWQRCCVHFLRHARDRLSRSADPACLEGLKRLWGHEHVGEAREALGVVWVARWGHEKGFGRLVDWVEDPVEEKLTVYRLLREHRSRMKSTNMLERYNEELHPADYTHLPLNFYLSGRNSVYSYRRSRVLSAGRGG